MATPTPVEQQVADLKKQVDALAADVKNITDDQAARDKKAADDAVETAKKMADIDALAADVKAIKDAKAAKAPDELAKRIEHLEHRVAGTAAKGEEAPPMQWVYPKSGEPRCLPQAEALELLKDTANYADTPAKWQ